MIEKTTAENSQHKSPNDPKVRMLAALANKQKGQKTGKATGPSKGSKVGAGKTTGSAPKMHRRKAGSA